MEPLLPRGERKRIEELQYREKTRKPTYYDVEGFLVFWFFWFFDSRAKGLPITGPILLKACSLGFMLSHEDFKPGCAKALAPRQRFEDRHSISYKNIVGNAASPDDESLQPWLGKHLDRIFATYADRNICNADETGPFYRLLPTKTLPSKDEKCVGAKTSKEHVTLLVCANMDGSDKRKLTRLSHKLQG